MKHFSVTMSFVLVLAGICFLAAFSSIAVSQVPDRPSQQRESVAVTESSVDRGIIWMLDSLPAFSASQASFDYVRGFSFRDDATLHIYIEATTRKTPEDSVWSNLWLYARVSRHANPTVRNYGVLKGQGFLLAQAPMIRTEAHCAVTVRDNVLSGTDTVLYDGFFRELDRYFDGDMRLPHSIQFRNLELTELTSVEQFDQVVEAHFMQQIQALMGLEDEQDILYRGAGIWSTYESPERAE